MSDAYVVETPSTGLAVSLAEGKFHLKIDDQEAGEKASLTLGTGNSQLVLAAKLEGIYANEFAAVVIASGNSTPLSVGYEAGLFTINLATDGGGTPTSTVAQVVSALLANPTIAQKIIATQGVGDGTGLLAVASETPFTGGVDGVSFEDDYVTALLMAGQAQAENILRKKILTTGMIKKEYRFPCGRGAIELDWGYVQSVDEVRYYDSNGDVQALSDPYDIFELDNVSVPALLSLLPGEYWPSVQYDRSYPLQIAFTVGYGGPLDVPEDIKLAIKLMVGHWYSNRENVMVSSGLTSLVIPFGAETLLWAKRDYRF